MSPYINTPLSFEIDLDGEAEQEAYEAADRYAEEHGCTLEEAFDAIECLALEADQYAAEIAAADAEYDYY